MASQLAITRIERLVWVLIYGGLLSFVVSLFLPDQEATLGAWMAGVGLAVAAVGGVLVYVRSKMTEKKMTDFK